MKNKNEHEDDTNYLSIFMCLGLSVGVAIGTAMDNIPTCMSIGLCVGVGIGAALDGRKRDKEE